MVILKNLCSFASCHHDACWKVDSWIDSSEGPKGAVLVWSIFVLGNDW